MQLTNKIKERTLNRMCVSVSASRSRSWSFQGTSHVNYLVIKTYKLAEQTGSYTPNPTSRHGKSTVAEIGVHGMGLEQEGKVNIMEITSGYRPVNESKIDGLGRVKETKPKRRTTTDMLEV